MKRTPATRRKSSGSRDQGDSLFSLLHAASVLEKRIDGALSEHGLSLSKFGVLEALSKAGAPIALSELAARLSCVRSNMTRLVDGLEADGLVIRIPTPGDRRVIRAQLTPTGDRRHTAASRLMTELKREFSRALRESDRASLERIAEALE